MHITVCIAYTFIGEAEECRTLHAGATELTMVSTTQQIDEWVL